MPLRGRGREAPLVRFGFLRNSEEDTREMVRVGMWVIVSGKVRVRVRVSNLFCGMVRKRGVKHGWVAP